MNTLSGSGNGAAGAGSDPGRVESMVARLAMVSSLLGRSCVRLERTPSITAPLVTAGDRFAEQHQCQVDWARLNAGRLRRVSAQRREPEIFRLRRTRVLGRATARLQTLPGGNARRGDASAAARECSTSSWPGSGKPVEELA